MCTLTRVCELFVFTVYLFVAVVGRPQFNQQFPQKPGSGFSFLTTSQPPRATTNRTINSVNGRSPQYLACIQDCPTTMEYNPVCGSDAQNYYNEWRLQCAQRCGQNVSLARVGTCAT